MSQKYPDRLSIHRAAKLWAAEAGVDAQDIEDDLIDAALTGEFQFRPDEIARGEDVARPANFDIRLGLQVETFNQNGDPVTALDLKKYINPPDRWRPGAPPRGSAHAEKAARQRELAKGTLISMNGLRRWCDQPGFLEWATPRELERPIFIAEHKVATTGDAAEDIQSAKGKGSRHFDKGKDALLRNRIEAALSAARKLPRSKNNPMSIHAMAKALEKTHGKELGFGFETFRRILADNYRPMKRLGIPGLNTHR